MPEIYGTLEEADAYHEDRGNAAWTGEDASKEAALLRASAWLDGAYGFRFPGSKTGGREQERAWPRTEAIDVEGEEIADDEIPREIKHATFEAALRELASPGSLAPDYTLAQAVKSERVGQISIEYRDAINPESFRPTLMLIDDILASLLGAKSPVLFGATTRAY